MRTERSRPPEWPAREGRAVVRDVVRAAEQAGWSVGSPPPRPWTERAAPPPGPDAKSNPARQSGQRFGW